MKLRITYNAPVVLTFTIAAVAVYVMVSLMPQVGVWFAAQPHLGDAPSYVGLVTHILRHASWEHLLGNFMLILLLGPILEEKYGSFGLAGMILVTALATGLATLALSSNGVIGASGIVFMMILLASTANIRGGGEIPMTFIAVALIYLGGEIYKSISHDPHDQVSHLAHLVGGGVGAVFGFLTGGRKLSRSKAVAKAAGDADLAKLLAAGPKPS